MLCRITSTCLIAGVIILSPSLSRAQVNPSISRSNRSSDLLSSPNKAPAKTVQLNLGDVIKLVLQGNRDLKNAALDRIVQKQELKEAESKFSPQITPSFSINFTQNLSGSESFDFSDDSGISTSSDTKSPSSNSSPNASGIGRQSATGSGTTSSGSSSSGSSGSTSSSLGSTFSSGGTSSADTSGTGVGNFIGSGTSDGIIPSTTNGQDVQVSASLLTRIGTQLSLTVSPLSSQKLELSVSQPLLRGAGKTVNEASVKTARFTEKQNVLTFQQGYIDKLTETIVAYRNLIKTQETVRIQSLALANKQKQLGFTKLLVDAGRKAKVELVEVEKSIADTQQSLGTAQNELAQANSELLRLIESDQPLTIAVPASDIKAIDNSQLPQILRSPEDLVTLAFQKRLDYQQAQIAIQTEKLNQRLAKNNLLWNFDFQSNISIGETSQASAGLVLKKTFGDRSLRTEVVRRRIEVQKNENKLTQLTTNIRREVTDALRDLNSSLNQVKTAQKAREFAEQQLQISQERFRRRSGQITLFEIIQKQDDLVTAQNNELNTKIDYLNTITNLEKVIGLTLDTWQDLIAANQSLVQ